LMKRERERKREEEIIIFKYKRRREKTDRELMDVDGWRMLMGDADESDKKSKK